MFQRLFKRPNALSIKDPNHVDVCLSLAVKPPHESHTYITHQLMTGVDSAFYYNCLRDGK